MVTVLVPTMVGAGDWLGGTGDTTGAGIWTTTLWVAWPDAPAGSVTMQLMVKEPVAMGAVQFVDPAEVDEKLPRFGLTDQAKVMPELWSGSLGRASREISPPADTVLVPTMIGAGG